MKFADTSCRLARLNPDDEFHAAATASSGKLEEIVVTTMWVLTELGDALHRGRNRATFVRFLDTLGGHEDFEVVPASAELFQRGVEFFRARPDKEWSLTDCISFLVMTEKGISEALTTDRHFKQAGFFRCSDRSCGFSSPNYEPREAIPVARPRMWRAPRKLIQAL